MLRTDEFRGFEKGDDLFLTDGASVFHLRPLAGEAHAWIAEDFFSKPPRTQANFWCFGLLKLLRPLGLYSLHAAAVGSEDGQWLLFVGSSGSGKSTLAIGLIEAGWSYLSDDAVLLRDRDTHVQATACRKSFYIDAASSARYPAFSLEEGEPDASGGTRRRIGIEKAFPERYARECSPRTIIFPTITARARSKLTPIGNLEAIHLLLRQSAAQLFDRRTMPAHLELLRKLAHQAETFALESGRDLYDEPSNLGEIIEDARGAITCRAS